LGVSMQLSEIGKIAKKYWLEIPNHFPFVKLKSFVVMPNHIHGIIVIEKNNNNVVETLKLGVSTTTDKKSIGGKNNKWKSGTLGTIINQYKRICTINARKTNNQFGWQPRFYDHIIRDEKSYKNISEYIINNPHNWKKDELFK
ncbi:MAG: transposase, partial [Candidatus Cloacimonetes bacterium]|nr:transposase [Candidatus Cloacimonadota bacterium]